MYGVDAVVGWVGALDEDGLVRLLERRPMLLAAAPPADLTELAERLVHPASLIEVLRTAPQPYLQLCEAAASLGDGCTREDLVGLLDGSGPAHVVEVNEVLDALVADAVVAVDDVRICVPDAFEEIFAAPLDLGSPLAVLLRGWSVDAMRRSQKALGLSPQQNRADTVASLLGHLGDPDTVRAIVADAPPQVADDLGSLAAGVLPDETADAQQIRRWQHALEWAGERGLLMGSSYGFDWQMPAEVGLALRGPEYRAPFHPRPPASTSHPVDAERVDADSAAAATHFADHVLTVLDQIARRPIPGLKSGGVGARELTRLAKSIAAEEVAVRMVLELASATGLVGWSDRQVTVTDDFSVWRDLDPGTRYAELLRTWSSLGNIPTEVRDADGTALRALGRREVCEGCRTARTTLLEALAGLDGAGDRAEIAELIRWRRPLVHQLAQDDEDPHATVWREAETLGVVAQGALSRLGRVLLDGGADAVDRHVAQLLPPSADQATFGADLTVYVVGAPSTRVSRLLDWAADREGRGGAVVWRFGPDSVRRALDEGISAEQLTVELAAVASGELPQPLRYLIADVARRHGALRLARAGTCVYGADPALLAEVAADRRLAKLGLRTLAPTVLVSDASVDDLLSSLRAAGHAPVAEDGSGRPVRLTGSRRGAQDRGGSSDMVASARRRALSAAKLREMYPEPERADPGAVAAALIRRGTGPGVSRTRRERHLDTLAKSLSTTEIRQLAHALDTGSRVGIEYESASGRRTRRVIDQPELSGPNVFAWCELRNDDRVFTVSRIRAVTPI